jgi:hypothetical protein
MSPRACRNARDRSTYGRGTVRLVHYIALQKRGQACAHPEGGCRPAAVHSPKVAAGRPAAAVPQGRGYSGSVPHYQYTCSVYCVHACGEENQLGRACQPEGHAQEQVWPLDTITHTCLNSYALDPGICEVRRVATLSVVLLKLVQVGTQ